MEKSTCWVWGRKGKRSPKEEVASPPDTAAWELIQVAGITGGDDHRVAGNGAGEGKWAGKNNLVVVAAAACSAVTWKVTGDAAAVSWVVSGDDEVDYPPRKFNKYVSIAEVYLATDPPPHLMIINSNDNNKPRTKSKPPTNNDMENNKKVKRVMKRKNEKEEEGNKVLNDGYNGNFIDVDYFSSSSEEETTEMETRKPKFRSILELYKVTHQQHMSW